MKSNFKIIVISVLLLSQSILSCSQTKSLKNSQQMSNTKNKETIQFLYDSIFNVQKFEKLPTLLSADYTNPVGAKGIDAFKKSIVELANAFPDAEWKIEDIIAEDNKVVVKQKFVGTHKNQFQNIIPTNKPVSVNGIATYILKNNKIIFSEIQTDRFSFLQQLEVLPNQPNKANNSSAVFLIDKFFVPKSSVTEFKERMTYNRTVIKTLSGFVKDNIFENYDESKNLTIVTVAEWENQKKLDKAKTAVQSEFKRIGFNAKEFYERLNIKMERGQYQPFQE